MTRYFVHIAYDGAAYCGWQSQPEVNTVQDTIEEAMSRVLRSDISIIGCGRTDTGVHAAEYVFHFETDRILEDFIYRMNRILPEDIVFKKYYEVKDDVHARFNAVERSYFYQISLQKDPFQRDYAWRITRPLNAAKMQEALNHLMGKQDFSSFAKLNTDVKHHFCTVYKAEMEVTDNMLVVHISANRFLRNMIRAIVGTLLDVGLGKLEPEDFKKIIDLKDRSKAGTSAPANGLFLSEVIYPDNILK